jgi:hypothetical protein
MNRIQAPPGRLAFRYRAGRVALEEEIAALDFELSQMAQQA